VFLTGYSRGRWFELVIGPQKPVSLAKALIPSAPPLPENRILRFAFLAVVDGRLAEQNLTTHIEPNRLSELSSLDQPNHSF